MSEIAILTVKIPLGIKDRKMKSLWNNQEKMFVPICSSCCKRFPERTEFFVLNDSYFCFKCTNQYTSDKNEGEL